MVAPSLDGHRFVLRSSTASRVDPDAPTRFLYSEADGIVWGEYDGDTVERGRFVGRREPERIEVSFAHALRDGTVVTGTAVSRIEGEPGALRLVEDFEVDGVAHRSVCVEVGADDPGASSVGA